MQVNNKQPMMTGEYNRRRSSHKDRAFITALLMENANHHPWGRKNRIAEVAGRA
jgi:hypothetical protein